MILSRSISAVELKPLAALLALAVIAGAVSGLGTVWLLSIINFALNQRGMTEQVLLGFVALCAITLAARAGSDIATNLIGQRLVAEVRLWLARKILGAPIAALESYRDYRLVPILTHDVDMISDVAFVAAPLVISTLITFGCFAWLAWLSPFLCLLVVTFLTCGMWGQYLARRKGMAGFEASRATEDTLHKAYRTITAGAKELKLNRRRRETLFSAQIARAVGKIRRINASAINIFVIANAFGSALFFLLIAIVLVWQNLVPMPSEVLSGFVLVLLFLRGPVEQIITTLPAIARAQVAFKHISELSRHFDSLEPDIGEIGQGVADTHLALPPMIAFEGVQYVFPLAEGVEPFIFGPVDIVFKPGETVFIVGDNGSGKTTLVKLLLGLYAPHKGAIRLNGAAVTTENRDDYRQFFSTVLSDFHLFEDIAADEERIASEAFACLERVELAGKASVQEGRFSTTDLSTGQRKRLALVHAMLEGRPIIVFDEWAADQDPRFRRFFYEQVLADFKRQGKTLIVVSHDDRYFHLADRLLHLEGGKLVVDRCNPQARARELSSELASDEEAKQ